MTAGDGLARVTYLPGVQPPPEPAVVLSEAFGLAEGLDDETLEAGVVDTSCDDLSREAEERDALGRGKREVRAENVSMHALTRRGMSRWELEKTLRDREFEEDEIQEELERLEGVGLIDDAYLAETVVRAQRERKGLGRSAIIAELRRRHIDEEHFESALGQLEEDDEQSRANEIAEKRAGQLSSYDNETAKRRLTAFMMRKGYSSSVVRTAVDLALRGNAGGGVRFR
jgi:regulatory protein